MFQVTTNVEFLDENICRSTVAGRHALNLGEDGAAYLASWGMAMELGVSMEELAAAWEPHPGGPEWDDQVVTGAVGTGAWVLDWQRIEG